MIVNVSESPSGSAASRGTSEVTSSSMKIHWSSASGAWLVPDMILMVTVAALLSAMPSLAMNAKVSMPAKPELGV